MLSCFTQNHLRPWRPKRQARQIRAELTTRRECAWEHGTTLPAASQTQTVVPVSTFPHGQEVGDPIANNRRIGKRERCGLCGKVIDKAHIEAELYVYSRFTDTFYHPYGERGCVKPSTDEPDGSDPPITKSKRKTF